MPNPGLCEGEDVCGREVGACEGLYEGVDVWKRGGTMLRGWGKAKVWMCVGSYMNGTHTHTQPPLLLPHILYVHCTVCRNGRAMTSLGGS